ncbi:MAG: D-Ala-D-Ala carboxypeptidase family metallohydrolase, partial [Nannocystaceae bacterium]
TGDPTTGDPTTGDPTTGDPTTGEPEPEPEPEPELLCFPGPQNDWEACYPVHSPNPLPYTYPGPLNNDPNYRNPVAYLDLDMINNSDLVAPNFQIGEFVKPSWGNYVLLQPHAVAHMQAVRDSSGTVNINSGYRNPTHNANVGGATYSRHMYGDSFDFWGNASLNQLQAACQGENAGFIQLYESHIHCDWRNEAVNTLLFGNPDAPPPEDPLFGLTASLVLDGDSWSAPATGFDEGEPLRQWTAYDANEEVLGTWEGRQYIPPPGTVRLEVIVGGQLVRSIAP